MFNGTARYPSGALLINWQLVDVNGKVLGRLWLEDALN